LKRRLVLLAVIGIVVVAAVVSAVVLTTGGSGSGNGYPTAEQLYAQQAAYGTFGAYIPGGDPDEQDRSGSNVDQIIHFLGHDRYQLVVQNVGFLGYINSFSWRAPNFDVTGIVNSGSGSCRGSNVASFTTQFGDLPEGVVTCAGFAIAPPKCSCEGGGTATITFEGHPYGSKKGVQFGLAESRIELGNLTLVPYHIPSYRGGTGNEVDLPLCAKGQVPSKTRPCVATT
jgi:hypothetical protein